MLRKFLKQLKTIRKRVPIAVLAAVLSLSQTLTAHAADPEPDDYVFAVVLRACGIPAFAQTGQWAAAYEGYLESIGDREMLAKFRSYSSLPWGGTAEGVDDLYWSVKGWLSQDTFSYAQIGEFDVRYTIPSSPLPNGQPSAPGMCGISSVPFPEGGSLPEGESAGYGFCFAYMYEEDYEGARRWVYKNVYIPDGSVLFGTFSTYSAYVDGMILNFSLCDRSDRSLLDKSSIKVMSGWRYADAEVFFNDPEPESLPISINVGTRSLVGCPFTVFTAGYDFSNWRKGEDIRYSFGQNTAALWTSGAFYGVFKESILSQDSFCLGSSLILPEDPASAKSSLDSLRRNLDVETLFSSLSSVGAEVAQGARYKVEHYTQGLLSPDGSWEWVKAGEEYLTGTSGEQAAAEPGTYENHVFAPELTQPEDLTISPDGSLVVRLYYRGDPGAVFPYTVEYYKDGQLFDSAHGTVPMFGDRTVTDCQDLCPDYYLPDPSKTPLPFTVSEADHVIRVYYVQNRSDPVAALFNGLSGAMGSAYRMAGKMVVFLLLPVLGTGLVVAGVKAFKDTIYKTQGKGS